MVYQSRGLGLIWPLGMLSLLAKAISLTGGVLEIAIVVRLVRQNLWSREFPFFFTYICYGILNVILLLISADFASKHTYFAIFSVSQAVYTLLGLLAINESFRKVFRVYYLRQSWFNFLVPAVLLLIMLSALWNWARHAPVQAGPLTVIYISLDLTANYLRAGLFGLFGILVFFWRTKWQQRPFGIIMGFGIFSVIGMIADALRSDFGIKMNLIFSYASAVAYLIACLVWFHSFRRPKQDSDYQPPPDVDPKELLELLEHHTNLQRGRGTSRDADQSFSGVGPDHSLRAHWPLPGNSPAIPLRS